MYLLQKINMKLQAFLLLIILFASCQSDRHTKSQHDKKSKKDAYKPTIAILPFNDVNGNLIAELKSNIQKQLTADVFILNSAALPTTAFYKPRKRYIADSLLEFLDKTNLNKYEKIIGVTTKDISTKKGDIENWGILGLGNCPGEACVISSFRAGKNIVSAKIFLRRMTSLALHELGHTYGLQHCSSPVCLMKDAEGKMNLDDGDTFCEKCKGYLIHNGKVK
jgi:archaemetzincin